MIRPTNHSFPLLVMTPTETVQADGTVVIDYGPPARPATAIITIDWPELLKRLARATADRAESLNAEGCFSVIVKVVKPDADQGGGS